MNYNEALEYSLTVPWKTITCTEGERCWCRIITPEDELHDDDGNEVYIAGSGSIHKIHAEHIVKLHNESLKGNVVIPRIVKLNEEVLMLSNDGLYRSNDGWYVGYITKNGKLYSFSGDESIHNIELIPVSEEEWRKI